MTPVLSLVATSRLAERRCRQAGGTLPVEDVVAWLVNSAACKTTEPGLGSTSQRSSAALRPRATVRAGPAYASPPQPRSPYEQRQRTRRSGLSRREDGGGGSDF